MNHLKRFTVPYVGNGLLTKIKEIILESWDLIEFLMNTPSVSVSLRLSVSCFEHQGNFLLLIGCHFRELKSVSERVRLNIFDSYVIGRPNKAHKCPLPSLRIIFIIVH